MFLLYFCLMCLHVVCHVLSYVMWCLSCVVLYVMWCLSCVVLYVMWCLSSVVLCCLICYVVFV